jgi:hypothetical protein
MKLYMIRWPNGTTSVVGAPTRQEALFFADCEWEDPYAGEIQELKHFAMDIRPTLIDGQIDFMVDFGPFGGDPDYHLGPKAYPLIDAFKAWNHDATKSTPEEVFAAEMARLRNLKPPDQMEAVTAAADTPPSNA